MSAVMVSSGSGSSSAASRHREGTGSAPVGVLADGTPFYAPIGEVLVDDSRVICHLCGRALRSVTAHLRVHGWTKDDYHAVASALRRHGLTQTAHAAKRHAARQRSAQVAARLGFDSAAAYAAQRRAAGWTWQAMATESGQPQSWLRRRARDAPQRADATPPDEGAATVRAVPTAQGRTTS